MSVMFIGTSPVAGKITARAGGYEWSKPIPEYAEKAWKVDHECLFHFNQRLVHMMTVSLLYVK